MAAVTVVLDTNTRFDKNFAGRERGGGGGGERERERERELEFENFILKAL